MSQQKVPKILKSQVLIRAATDSDISFIFNSWLKSYKQSAFAKYVQGPVYFNLHHKTIEAILKRSKVLIACNPKDQNQIYGYLCTETQQDTVVIHYAYTKEAFRRMGILSILLEEVKLPEAYYYSHSTIGGASVVTAINKKGVYNPYLAFLELVP